MPLTPFDVNKHHVGLGVDGANLKGFTLVGAYAKELQQETPPSSADWGGQFDLLARDTPQTSRWTQDDFTGGAFQYRLEKDLAMFADCTGFIPAQQSRSLITVPPVKFKKAFDPSAQSNPGARQTAQPVSMFTIAGSVYTCFEHGILRYRQDNDTNQWGNWLVDANHYYAGAMYDLNEQIIYVLLNTTLTTDSPRLLRISPTTLDTTPYAIGTFDPSVKLPKTKGKVGKGFQMGGQNIVVGIGLRLYTCAPPEDVTDISAQATWTHIGRLPGYWVDSIAYNGMTYILCATVDGKTQLVAFDGTAVLPITDFPFNFRGKCMTAYGGRVYVGGSGTDINGAVRYAELHEVTGSSVRLVRTFAPESYQSRVTFAKNIWDLVVDEGLLFFSEKGKRLMAYDLTSDGFFGASELQQTNLILYRHVVGRERVWSWGTHDTDATKHGLYRIAIAGDAVSAYTPQVVTSDFIAEPALKKRWDKIVVLSRYHAASSVEYSTDGGSTWTALAGGDLSTEQFGDLWYTTCNLAGVATTPHIRFRIGVSMGTDVATFGELIAFSVAFSFTSSTGALKHGWSISLNGSESVEGFDATTLAQDMATLASTIWGWAEAKQKLVYKDVDGTQYTVKIQGLTEQKPVVSPERRECYLPLTLLEQ